MEIYAFDPFVPADVIEKDGAKAVSSIEELYSTCNYVSLHIPATPETKKSIGYDLLSKMPKGGCLVNTARKEVIDEEGLAKVLEERADLKYVTDIIPDSHGGDEGRNDKDDVMVYFPCLHKHSGVESCKCGDAYNQHREPVATEETAEGGVGKAYQQ